ncbi:MAG: hypothetical protein U0R52_02165 [Solirubrobacterales bacterium]
MGKRFYAGLSVGLMVAVAVSLAIGNVFAAGGSRQRVVDFPAPAFVPVTSSTNNNAGNSVCGSFAARNPQDPGLLNSENRGDLNAVKGSSLTGLNLPQGARIGSLALFVNDNDGDFDAHLLLVRKRLKAGLSPQFNGYAVIASVKSSGAVLNTMRKFTDRTVAKNPVDNRNFDYYLELVNCGTIEPFAAQIAFKP